MNACAAPQPGAPEPGRAAQVSVKALAEFVHRRGDIHYRYASSALAREGIARQQAWQRGRGASYQREVRVAANHGALRVSGRVDGWDPAAGLVEEVKTTRANATDLHAHVGDANLAQLRLYAAMLALAVPSIAALRLRLVYLHPEQPTETAFDERWRRADLIAYFEATCGVYAAWRHGVRRRLAARDAGLRRLQFPYGAFRAGQRLMATRLYRAFRDGAHCLMEAPTGAGKTMASVFPAVKAMGERALDRLVFLTARTTGQRAAEDALAQVLASRPSGAEQGLADNLVAITITAKERICFNPGTPCDPAKCGFARGYHARLPPARRALLAAGFAGREVVERVARAHSVCPFELSLDAAAWADIVICDYNYVFDPVVRLTRLDNDDFRRVGVVVDEAHQLAERVREMLSAALSRNVVRAALKCGPPAAVAKRLRSVDRALAALGRGGTDDEARIISRPDALQRAIGRLTTAFATAVETDLTAWPAVADAYWQLLRFERAMAWSAAPDSPPEAFHFVARGRAAALRVELACATAAHHVQATMAAFQGTVRQSGTLTPASVFQAMHGFGPDAPTYSVGRQGGARPFAAFVVPDVSTYYRARQRTLPALAALIAEVAAATPGNTLVAFPSFAYLTAYLLHQGANDACSGFEVRAQEAEMSAEARRDFIAWLNAAAGKRVGLVVMGGAFAESVDFDSQALRAAVVVGPGLPPRSLRRDLIAAAHAAAAPPNSPAEFGAAPHTGFDIAYRQPAMTRVAQAVGRVARGPDAPGVAVLVDPRFTQAAYTAFLPAHWHPTSIPRHRLDHAVRAFWRNHDRAAAPARATSDQRSVRAGASAGRPGWPSQEGPIRACAQLRQMSRCAHRATLFAQGETI